MAGEGTKRIIDLTEAAETQSGDYIAIDSTGRGTRKLPAGFMATAEDLSEEQTARQTADATLDGKITSETQARIAADNEIGEQITALDEKTEADAALIQNPTKTLSGALVSFTDGADMPMVACTAEIVPKQSGSGTPSPENVRQISGWESVSVYDKGKNLLEVSMTDGEVSGVTYTKNADGSISCVGTITGTQAKYISSTASITSLKEGVTYVLSGGDEVSASGIRVVSSIKNADGSVARWIDVTTASGYTFTLSEGQTLTSIYLRGATTGTAVNVTIRPMIRLASDTDPTYEPHTGTTTTIDLGRTVYGGTLDVVSGELTVTHGIITVNGESNVQRNAGTDENTRFILSVSDSLSVENSDTVIRTASDKFRSIAGAGNISTDSYCTSLLSLNRLQFYLPTSVASSVADARTWFTNNPTTVVYELATPQTYTLTPTQVNTLLGENNVWADSGDVEITYRRDISIVINNLESALNG